VKTISVLLMRVNSPVNNDVVYPQFYKKYMFRPAIALRHMRGYGSFYLKNPIIFRSLLDIRKII